MAGLVPQIPPIERILLGLPRVRVKTQAAFDQILDAANPVIIEGSDVGPCTGLWTNTYLKERVGTEHKVRSSISWAFGTLY